MAGVLAVIGVYGVLSYEVWQRRHELAIRCAVGASPTDIFRAIVRRGLLVGSAGVAAGLVLSASVTHTLRALLFEVQPLDPPVFVAGAAALLAAVVAAASIPARRASGTDPAAALRME